MWNGIHFSLFLPCISNRWPVHPDSVFLVFLICLLSSKSPANPLRYWNWIIISLGFPSYVLAFTWYPEWSKHEHLIMLLSTLLFIKGPLLVCSSQVPVCGIKSLKDPDPDFCLTSSFFSHSSYLALTITNCAWYLIKLSYFICNILCTPCSLCMGKHT